MEGGRYEFVPARMKKKNIYRKRSALYVLYYNQ